MNKHEIPVVKMHVEMNARNRNVEVISWFEIILIKTDKSAFFDVHITGVWNIKINVEFVNISSKCINITNNEQYFLIY